MFFKNRSKYDQVFINDEEDRTHIKSRFTQIPKIRIKNQALSKDYVFLKRSPGVAQ